MSVSEKKLDILLANLRPHVDGKPCSIRQLPSGVAAPEGALLVFREENSLTVIHPSDATGDDQLWAHITLKVHSSLEAVGLLAAVTRALADADIACNVVSAFFHDHLFVPWERRHQALRQLEALESRAQEALP
jgi:uncharacterized protein